MVMLLGAGFFMFIGGYGYKKYLGLILLCVGGVIIFCFVPFWMLCFFLGSALIVLGILMLCRRY